MKEIFYAIWIPVFIGGLIWAIVVGLGRSERVQCLQWQSDAKQYPGFYLTNWQKGQCDAHGITIDAPVVGSGK